VNITHPSATAIIFTCGDCAAEFFPKPPGRLSDLGISQPGDPHAAIVHASCAADFVANGFDLVPGIVEGTNEPGLFCPHLPPDGDLPQKGPAW